VWYSRQYNADKICQASRQFKDHKICAVKKTVKCSHKLCGTADILILKQYVWYRRQFNPHTKCAEQQKV